MHRGAHKQLEEWGMQVIPHAFADHYEFSPADINFPDPLPILMTEKDAVKCKHFANNKHWVVAVSVQLPEIFDETVLRLVKERKNAG